MTASTTPSPGARHFPDRPSNSVDQEGAQGGARHFSGPHSPSQMARPRCAHFWTFNLDSPSFRHRLAPVADELEARGWTCVRTQLSGGNYFRRFWDRRDDLATADLMVLAKINLAFGEERLLRRLTPRLSLDFDDAVYLRQRKKLGAPPEISCIRLARFNRTARTCDLVTVGNRRLASVALRSAPAQVEIVPTSVEVPPALPDRRRDGRTLVWIGLDRNLVYLQLIRPALQRLVASHPDLRLRIVCDTWPDWPEMPIERVPWSEAGEFEALATADIGLMPLTDDAWTRGKCSFKLLQYMAAGLPTVASPVGTNPDVVLHETTGSLAASEEDWYQALHRLLCSRDLRQRMGAAGFAHARANYERSSVARRHASLYEDLVATPSAFSVAR